MRVHYTAAYLLAPQHKVTVNLIGVGGTGSRVLTALGTINEALRGLDHPGLHVTAYDGDMVSESNKGRQLFSAADIGLNKAMVLINRINRHYGLDWVAVPTSFDVLAKSANITISCVDTAAARVMISNALSRRLPIDPMQTAMYWLDFGNGKKTGQAVLGTVGKIAQPKNKAFKDYKAKLPTVLEVFPELRKMKEDNEPSCSMAQALGKQDLFINPTLAQAGMNLIWKLFKEGCIRDHGIYLNLDTMTMNPIKVK